MKRIVSFGIAAVVASWIGVGPANASTLMVTKQDDSDDGVCDADCSLREAIEAAGPTDTIVFAQMSAGVLTLGLGELVVDKAVTIAGPGEKLLTISGGDTQRIFDVTPTGSLTASQLTLAHGKGEYYPPLGVEAAGAILCSGDLAMTDCTFSDNHADGRATDQYVNDAAVLYSDAVNHTLTFTRCSFLDNTAGGGACIDIDKGRLTITDTLFSGNYGAYGPACVIGNSTDPLIIAGSTFVENMARGGGGLFLSGSGGATVKDTTFFSNTSMSGFGGGIEVFATTGAVLSNVTMSANVGSLGANLYSTGGAVVVVRNSILANTSSNCGGSGSILSHGYNLDSGTTCAFSGSGDRNATPAKLADLADSGGRTPTMALLWSSMAINSGNPLAAGSGGDACEPVDQRGYSRPQFARCDIGAFESTGPETLGDSGFHSATDDTLYSWPAQDGVTQFQIKRSGTPAFSDGCVNAAVSGTSWADFEVPLPGAGFYYMNRPSAPQVGTFGWDSDGIERTPACP